MIKVEQGTLKHILKGRPTRLADIKGAYRRDHDYALGLRGRRSSTCRVQILDIRGNTLIVRLIALDKPRLLAARSEHGYTDDLHQAMPHEPEAISEADHQHITSIARDRHDREHAEELALQDARSLLIRLKEARRHKDSAEFWRLHSELRGRGIDTTGASTTISQRGPLQASA